ncbi:MAG: response regulator transcription factor [Bacteroidota bacterium]|jgi:two-component system alkaline phosphatase synthesis response regulator PhoP
MKGRLLLVEDEENLRSTIALNLELEGYEVLCAENGKEALQLFKSNRFDLVVLDIMLPEINGLDVCREIRKENRNVFILFLSARSMGSERIEGLKAGADDYLSKPFNLEELLLRIEILLKRKNSGASLKSINSAVINARIIHFDTYQFTSADGKIVSLSKKETLLLKLLIEKKNQVVSREEILEQVWGYENFPTGRTIDNFILAFRKYFEVDPSQPKLFISVRGVGYKYTEAESSNN